MKIFATFIVALSIFTLQPNYSIAKNNDLALFKQFTYGMSKSDVNKIVKINPFDENGNISIFSSAEKIKFLDIDWDILFEFSDDSLLKVMLNLDNSTEINFKSVFIALGKSGFTPIMLKSGKKTLYLPEIDKTYGKDAPKIIDDFGNKFLKNDDKYVVFLIPKEFYKLALNSAKPNFGEFILKSAPDSMRDISLTHGPNYMVLQFSFPKLSMKHKLQGEIKEKF